MSPRKPTVSVTNEQIFDLLQKLDGKVDAQNNRLTDVMGEVSGLKASAAARDTNTALWFSGTWPEYKKSMEARFKSLDEQRSALEKEVGELREFRSKAAGYMAAAAALTSAVSSAVVGIVVHALGKV